MRKAGTSMNVSTSTPTRQVGGKLKAHESLDIVPDSEEERKSSSAKGHASFRVTTQVIEISSDEESDCESPEEDPFSTPTLPGSWPRSAEKQKANPSLKSNGKKKFPPSRRVVESSDSEDDSPRQEVIELSDSDNTSPELEPPRQEEAKLRAPTTLSLYADDDDDEPYYRRDEAILVLDEPKSHRKTMRITHESIVDSPTPSSPRKHPQPKAATTSVISSNVTSSIFTPSKSGAASTSTSPMKKRTSAKAKREERLNELKEYAEKLYDELNQKIFGKKLPDAPLQWNTRLLTTAGKAQWHRSREGIETSSIQLATKILVDEDRIRKTLAHEMCHLACWIIDRNPKEAHGSLFKSWARRVEAKRPDITVSVTHDYEITHPYNWKCADCGLNYGRFSKSIDPARHGCGTCGSRNLIPQFETRTKTPKTPRVSRMAASRPRDSPSLVSVSSTPSVTPSASQSSLASDDEIEVSCVQHNPGVGYISDSDSDIEFIATKLATATIATAQVS
ncbi:hypothetical protein VKT23_003011 [Stygiomarasmius scandens]|uniref:SprT-like domain-containing protein n=1 Tax=Marasmiellus scandens TaxID=2682957 RepID=A0ABR1JWG8_9AGAR